MIAPGGKRVAVFGGSFDPPHLSHVLAAAYVLGAEEVDEVLAVPTFEHALDKEASAGFDDRVSMTERAFSDLRRVSVSPIERSLGTPSRTLTTLEALLDTDPTLSLRLLIGADIIGEIDRWYRFDEIRALAPPIVVGRGGYERPRDACVDLPAISSTDVRERLSSGRSVEGLVPRSVIEYIEAHELYRGSET